MITLAEKYVMMIEPDKDGEKAETPIEDNLSLAMEELLDMCDHRGRYRGRHTTNCNEHSDNRDWILPGGQVTNSLAAYYMKYYRPFIPQSEINKVKTLIETYTKTKL